MLLLLSTLPWALATDPYASALAKHLTEGKVDYAALHADDALGPVVTALATAKVPSDRAEATAFWINAYNALTLDLVADAWPIDSIRSLDGGKVWDTRTFVVAGKSTTLDQIENDLRRLGDPRIHAALNCASKSCPPLAPVPYDGLHLDAQLDAETRLWMKTTALRIDRAARTVAFGMVFEWFADDFASTPGADVPGVEGHADAAARFAARYTDEADAAFLRAGNFAPLWLDYDWGVNAR